MKFSGKWVPEFLSSVEQVAGIQARGRRGGGVAADVRRLMLSAPQGDQQ